MPDPKNKTATSKKTQSLMDSTKPPTAKKFLGELPEAPGWYYFELVNCPDHPTYMALNSETCTVMIRTWDRQSNYCQHFTGGEWPQLLVPARVMQQVVNYLCCSFAG